MPEDQRFMSYGEWELEKFTNKLGSGEAVPGGGGASALAGALGASLAGMVASLTVGKKKYASVQDEMESVILEASNLSDALLGLIDLDAKMFEPLSKAYSLPKGTDEEILKRESIMAEALKNACSAPLMIMEKVCRALDLVEIVFLKGSRLAVSDAGDAAVLCKASMQAAALNVYINTKLMKDRTLAMEYNRKADEMMQEYCPKADGIYEAVRKSLLGSDV